MNAIISEAGGRAPPARNTPVRSSEFHWLSEAGGAQVPTV